MATIYELKKRAKELAAVSETNTVDPARVGNLIDDTLELIDEYDKNVVSLGIRKTYATVAAMEADKSPSGDDGKKLRFGQLVSVYDTGNAAAVDNGKVFAWQNPGWRLSSRVDAGYARKEEMNLIETTIEETTQTVNVTDRQDAFYVTDRCGKVICRIDADGIDAVNIRTILNRIVELEARDQVDSSYSDSFYMTDARGRVIFKVDNNGADWAGKKEDSAKASGTKMKDGLFDADVNLILSYGQSLAGASASSSNVEMPANCLMFMPNDAKNFNGISVAYTYDDIVADIDGTWQEGYFGDDFQHCIGTGAEGTLKRLMLMYSSLIANENGVNLDDCGFEFVPATVMNGSSILYKSKPLGEKEYTSTQYAYYMILQIVRNAKRIANGQSKTFACPVLYWIQSESDYASQNGANWESCEYRTSFLKLVSDLTTDIKRITGQTKDVQIITYQPASWGNAAYQNTAKEAGGYAISQVFLNTAKSVDNVHLGATMYQLAYSDELHLSDAGGYMMMGAIAGVVAKRAITDNHPAPLILPKKHSITVLDDGIYLLDVEFDVPYPPLVVDAGGGKYNNVNGLQVNYGFSIKSTGKDVIEQVYVKRQNHVVFVCSENPTGLTLAYANTGTRGGGNIRDSQGDNILININGTSTPVHNWMPIFEITI